MGETRKMREGRFSGLQLWYGIGWGFYTSHDAAFKPCINADAQEREFPFNLHKIVKYRVDYH